MKGFNLKTAQGQREWTDWAKSNISKISRERIVEYWEKSQPRNWVEAVKGYGNVEKTAFDWATGELMKAYESGNAFQDLVVNDETWKAHMERVLPVIFREHEKSANWLYRNLKDQDPKLVEWVEANGGSFKNARYIGNDAKNSTNVWFEIKLAIGYYQILYSYSEQMVLDENFIPFGG